MDIFKKVFSNIERWLIISSYSVMTVVIFTEVIRRFFFSVQSPWSTTIPIYLFLWITWMGASYNVYKRSHLSFDEIRSRFSYNWQFACLCLDAILWIVFSIIVIVYAAEQVYISYDNFSIVQGTDDVMQWWFYMATPLAFSLLIIRVLQNICKDIKAFRKKEKFQLKGSML